MLRIHRLFPAFILLVAGVCDRCLAEPISLEASPVNSIQIAAVKIRGSRIFEIQLGEGSNQPPRKTWVTGKAEIFTEGKSHAGYYRLSTDPNRQLRMQLKGRRGAYDEYAFARGYDKLRLEVAGSSDFAEILWSGEITAQSAAQELPGEESQNRDDQTGGDQNNDGQNNNGQNGQGQRNGSDHPPVVVVGKFIRRSGSSAASFSNGQSTIAIDVGGNQRLSVLSYGNTHSGMSIAEGQFYGPAKD